MTREQEVAKIKELYDLPRDKPIGIWIYQQWKLSQPIQGEPRCRVKFENNEETKLYKQLKIEKQKNWRDRVERGIEYLHDKDKNLFNLGHRYTKSQRSERKKIVMALVNEIELNFPQTTLAINEWAGKAATDVASVAYIYNF